MDIFVETVVTEDDVCITCAAGDYERDELSTLVDEVRFGSCLIDQSVELDGFTVYDSTEGLMGEPGFILLHR